jgi:segregation and condensation protein B
MSLKAKIEAVVYASEEPVTLAQLAGLFAADALALRRESSPDATVSIESPEQDLPLIAPANQSAAPPEPTQDLPAEASVDEGATGEDSPLDPVTGEPEPLASSSPEQDEKRAARQRDREVRDTLRGLLDELIADYETGDRGIEIREIAGGYRFATKPEYHDAVRGFVKRLKPPMKLTLQALETLAVIAYKQPVTAPEVSEIRGVDSSGVLGSLMARKLIATAGRKQVIGRPILYKTTKEFLLRFGLRDLAELPSIEEFEKMAGELAETDEAVEEAQNQSSIETDRELPFDNEVSDAPVVRATVDAIAEEGAENSERVPETPSHPQAESATPPQDIQQPVEAQS